MTPIQRLRSLPLAIRLLILFVGFPLCGIVFLIAPVILSTPGHPWVTEPLRLVAPGRMERKDAERRAYFTTPGRCLAVLVTDTQRIAGLRLRPRRRFNIMRLIQTQRTQRDQFDYGVEVFDKAALALHHPGTPPVFTIREPGIVGRDLILARFSSSTNEAETYTLAYVEFARSPDGQVTAGLSVHDEPVTGRDSTPRTGCAAHHPVLNAEHVNSLFRTFGNGMEAGGTVSAAGTPRTNLDATLNRIAQLVATGDPDDWQTAIDLVPPQDPLPEKPGVVWVRVRVPADSLDAFVNTMAAAGLAAAELLPAWDGDGYIEALPITRVHTLAIAHPDVEFQVLDVPAVSDQ